MSEEWTFTIKEKFNIDQIPVEVREYKAPEGSKEKEFGLPAPDVRYTFVIPKDGEKRYQATVLCLTAPLAETKPHFTLETYVPGCGIAIMVLEEFQTEPDYETVKQKVIETVSSATEFPIWKGQNVQQYAFPRFLVSIIFKDH
eukprot:TRINITY_DN2424_c0_g3_i3.p1 TRINITY_DN2424_c0_g3~~TRINITY_DN2424_c0_g3_i3.p1  ORF type:complete len:143 (+),score=31.53 TRINITY_DN2424_c0_g3_i3:146-574(+)